MAPSPQADRPAAGPDQSVRVAWADDAAAVARVQLEAWREEYAALLPAEVVESWDVEQFAAAWHQSLVQPKDARNRVLVALERNAVRGFALTSPSPDPDSDPIADGEIGELHVSPDHRRQGHGSRLLHACVDTLRKDRFTRATVWLAATDDARRRFFVESGWAADGAHRELDLYGDGAVQLRQVRLHTDLRED